MIFPKVGGGGERELIPPILKNSFFDKFNPGTIFKNYQELYNYPKGSQNSKKKIGFLKVGVQVHTHNFAWYLWVREIGLSA